MLLCEETVTFVRRIPGEEGDSYRCTAVSGASWYGKLKLFSGEKGAGMVPVVKVRIPAGALPEGFAPQKGDVVCKGELADVSRPKDWQDTEHFIAALVSDNRRGHNPHWGVSGSA